MDYRSTHTVKGLDISETIQDSQSLMGISAEMGWSSVSIGVLIEVGWCTPPQPDAHGLCGLRFVRISCIMPIRLDVASDSEDITGLQ